MLLPANRRWKLERMRRLLELFGHPEKCFTSVVIVGTKGKGSTGFFLQNILQETGVPAGFYSSPHLETPRERIRLHGQMIARPLWTSLLNHICGKLETAGSWTKQVTYFEVMTLMATLAFQQKKVRLGIFEAGMGGRLDAVNALGANVVLITPIHLDHEQFLGRTIAKIAAEKAAVIRPGSVVLSARQVPEAAKVIRGQVRRQRAALQSIRPLSRQPGLQGEHQRMNAALAQAAAKTLSQRLRFSLTEAVCRKGLSARRWPGRFECFQGHPRVILDAAHNPAAMAALRKALAGEGMKTPRVLIFGTAQDKNYQAMLKEISGFFEIAVLTPLPLPRSRAVAELLAAARQMTLAPVLLAAESAAEALALASAAAGRQGTITVTGSFYLIGKIRTMLGGRKKT